jgi:urocanate hydratase
MSLSDDDSQARILRTFTVLSTLRQDWGGALILSCGLGPQGASLALASNMAGAVCLSIEEDPDTLKHALRSGACDFIVNTLDEALRTMKNEVRKHLPLSVGLHGNLSFLLRELLARGVSPELCTNLTGDPSHDEAIRQFQSLGALLVDFGNGPRIEAALDARVLLETLTEGKQWQLCSFPFSTSATLRAFDARALAIIPAGDHLRSKWLQAAPRILQRERPIRRVLWLTEQEKQTLHPEFIAPSESSCD